jgi:hypothetical protein
MGGAVVLHIHRKEPQEWNGAILQAPMCKIAEKVKPPPLVVAILIKLANVVPTWKIVPTKDIINNAFKDPLKRQEVKSFFSLIFCPHRCAFWPRRSFHVFEWCAFWCRSSNITLSEYCAETYRLDMKISSIKWRG